MGKNFTVYINHDEFKDEDNKSGLLNKLLADHYSKVIGDQAQPETNESTYTEPEPTA